ncbi:hypothetical protein ACOCJ5_15830 [Knoellia sp. CPCC 206450]|uniref:hypothetical protein n=1 Tax=Knoellia tibetensis TaxID=3404798 RepID=UPI003B435E76
MTEAWTWSYEDADGGAVTGEPTTDAAFPTQSDAENWFGEVWRELADAGVAAVTLHRDGDKVYGPMRLDASV